MLKATSLNQIQLISTEIFIPQNWLWASKAAKLSSTEFCSKTTEVHFPTLWTESKGGLFSHTEQCTSLFTDNFAILKEAFRAFSKLDPQSLYISWPKNCTWTQQSRIFRKQRERQTQNDTECSQQNDAWEQVQINFSWKSTVLFFLNHWQCKAAHVSCTGFSSKAPDCIVLLYQLSLI